MKSKLLALSMIFVAMISIFPIPSLIAPKNISIPRSTASTTLVSASSSVALYVSKWTEYAYNPVFAAPDRSYCPSVVYDGDSFSGHGDSYTYKMWYNKKIAGAYKIGYAYSSDGISWTEHGAVIEEGFYPIVLYDPDGFGSLGGSYYKIWYEAGGPYSTNLYYAESNDGKIWTNTQLILWYPGNLLNDAYGPDGVLYNPAATNTGSDPMDYSYVMYVTCFYTPFATLLYYSPDGINWTVYVSGNPNNDIFPARTAAQQGIAYPTRFWVVKAGESGYVAFYDYFPPGYPAGTREIRCATSPDGKAGWQDICVIFSVLDGVAWRAGRTYQACVLHSEDWSTKWKMWFSGLPADESVYTVGYATADGPYPTIQSAIDAANPSDTVIVHEGTYVENVNVNKPLTLKAASCPVIDGNQTGPCVTIAVDGVTVEGFELTNGTYGVASWGTDNSVISDNVIHDNLNVPGYAGIGIMFWSDSDDFDNNTISGNEIYNNDRQGIYIGGTTLSYISEDNTISGNTIYNNGLNTTGMGPSPAWWADMYGIQLSFADGNTIVGNEIYGHDDWFPWGGTTFDFAQGIYLFDSNDNFVTDNYLHDNNYGVGLWRPSRAAGNNHINHNNIAGNTGYGVRTFDGPPAVDARFNWWGDASGPTHSSNPGGVGDIISDNVHYSPWLGFVVGTSPMTYHVNSTGKIQDAIDDASPGDTILVYNGTYREALLINKSLTLRAASNPVIEAPDTRNTYTIPESTATWDPIVFAYGGTLNTSTGAVSGSGTINVTMVGFEIDGRNNATAAPTRFVGILYRNINPGVISNNTIHDMYDADGKGDGPETFGILVYGDSNVTIEYNEVRDFSRGGIGVQGDAGAQPDPVGTVKRNTAVGNGLEPTAGWWAENGIQIAWGAGGSIVENNVSDCQVNNPYWASTGILVHFAAPGVNMLDNTVKDCDYGIGVASQSFDLIDGNVVTGSTWVGISLGWPVDNCTASNNLVSSNYIGIGVYDGSDNIIENNTIKNNEYGIWIDGDSHNNVITRNDILNNTVDGIHVEPFGGFAPSETVIHYNNIVRARAGIRLESGVTLTSVKGNVIRDFVKAGIVNRGSTDFTIERNIISTTIHEEAPNGIDIGIYTGTSGTVRENEISGCSWKDFTGDYDTSWSGSGILVIESGDSLEITRNTVYDCDVGMDIESDSMNITCNDVHSNIYGFVFWNANPLVHHNNIYNNTMYGVYRTPLGDLTGTLDAEYNWWGNATGPYHNVTNPSGTGDRVSDNVDYDPWLDGPIPGDVAIISITPSRPMACEGQILDIYVTVKNKGNLTVTFNVTLYYDSIAIGTQTVTDLTPGANTTLTFSWDTTGVAPCVNYTLSAEASTLPCETDTADNILVDGKVKINIFGDINGDGIVDIKDITQAALSFGSYPGHPEWNPAADMNNDHMIDIKDLVAIALNFGKTCP